MTPFIEKKYIKEVNGEYCVYSHQSGKSFGCYKTKPEAEARLAQMHKFKGDTMEPFVKEVGKVFVREVKGGSGSGNFGHEGRPGERGGSGEGGGGEGGASFTSRAESRGERAFAESRTMTPARVASMEDFHNVLAAANASTLLSVQNGKPKISKEELSTNLDKVESALSKTRESGKVPVELEVLEERISSAREQLSNGKVADAAKTLWGPRTWTGRKQGKA